MQRLGLVDETTPPAGRMFYPNAQAIELYKQLKEQGFYERMDAKSNQKAEFLR